MRGIKPMITYDEAYKKAKELKTNIDGCTEYENGYVFGSSGDRGYKGGKGHISIVVLKENGDIVTMPVFVMRGTGAEIRSFDC